MMLKMKALLACAVMLAVSAVSAKALMIAPAPVPLRVAGADAVVVGKVTSIEAKPVKAAMFKDDAREMQIAKVKVETTVLGRSAREIKVGFFSPMPIGPGGGIRPIRPGRGGVQLTADQEAMMLLTKHPTMKDTYVVQMYTDVVNKKGNPNFENELAEAKKYAKIIANPMTGLEAKDADERLLTASVLVTRYKTQKPHLTKTEAVPAKESKLILEALAKADWNARNPKPGFFMINAQTTFNRLGLTAKDGWTPPMDYNKFQAEAKKWLADNAGKYKIQRYVSEKKDEPDPEPK